VQYEQEWGCSRCFSWQPKIPSHGYWTSGDFTGEGTRAKFLGELGGTTRAGCEEEAKSGIGPRVKPSVFLRRSNHSTLHA
jgi:hypothetical protein